MKNIKLYKRGRYMCEHDRQRSQCKECGGFLTLAKMLHKYAKVRAKRSKLHFEITVQEILVLIGDGICPALKIPYNLALRKAADDSATLDKFNPALGYIKGNCAVISRLANTVKNSATVEQVCDVAEWMKRERQTNIKIGLDKQTELRDTYLALGS